MSATILASTVQPAGGTTLSPIIAFAYDTVVQCNVANAGPAVLTTPCLVSLLLSSDGGLTFVPAESRRFEAAATASSESFALREMCDRKFSAAVTWYTALGVANGAGVTRTFKPPWTHWMLMFGGNSGGSVTVSAQADGATSFGVLTVVPWASTTTIDQSRGAWQQVTLGGATTLDLINPSAQQLNLVLVQDATGSRTVSSWFPGYTVRWMGGSAPTLTTTAGKADVVTFKAIDSTTYLAGAALTNC